jgi:hypothetical protein
VELVALRRVTPPNRCEASEPGMLHSALLLLPLHNGSSFNMTLAFQKKEIG